MMQNIKIPAVSVHGGHSGEFCCHAEDTLEEIIGEYIRSGFEWVGISEHMPPVDDTFLYPVEIAAGLNAERMYERFERYIKICRELQNKYQNSIRIFTAMETEGYAGAVPFARKLVQDFRPDYIVGSVHHVKNIPIDSNPELYRQAAEAAGGTDYLYCLYFDMQYEMIQELKPEVIAHFDLIRIFDPAYPQRLQNTEIRKRIRRNLELIRKYDLILDFNLRALSKGMKEPYVSFPILKEALEMGIAVIPGDDSHGKNSVGQHMERGIRILEKAGADLNWRMPCNTESGNSVF